MVKKPANRASGDQTKRTASHRKLAAASRISRAEKWLAKCREAHGDYYDYSKSHYINARSKVVIFCPKHGAFEQEPRHHQSGFGCNSCGAERANAPRVTSQAEFLRRARAIHGNRYDYSKSVFKHGERVVIGCPVHGEVEVFATNHVGEQAAGCSQCAGNVQKTTEDFIAEARAVHDDRYDYSKVRYSGATDKVVIGCLDHGDFEQAPTMHTGGQGCPECGKRNIGQTHIARSRRTFVERLRKVHGDRYDYSLVDYTGKENDVTIVCPDHGPFDMKANTLLRGSGCHDCAEYGFKPNKPATLYYIRIDDRVWGTLYKIGITSRTVQKRFNRDVDKITVLREEHFNTGKAALKKEQRILKEFRSFLHPSAEPLSQGGNTELFMRDIFGLDCRAD